MTWWEDDGAAPKINEDSTGGWVEFWNNIFTPGLDAALAAGGAGGISKTFLGNGRYISAPVPANDGNRFKTTTPSRNIQVPAGEKLVVDGVEYSFSAPQILGSVPANFEGWVKPTYDTENDLWSIQTFAPNARPAKGAGVLGYVTANVDQILTIDVSEAKSDVIFTMPYLVSQMLAANAAIAGLLQGGNGEGGPFYWQTAAKSPTDDTTIEEAFTAADDALKAELARQIAGKDSRAMRSDVDDLRVEHAITRQNAGTVAPLGLLRSRSANMLRVTGGLYGTGENGYPDHIISTVPMHEDGTIGP